MDYVYLIIGVVFAGLGGELFVRGTVGLARWLRISPGIIGATVAAFATSSPEISVSITSALAKKPEIALGDALGSNVVNVALILGLALLFKEIEVPKGSIRRDFPVALFVPVITGLLFLDGILSRTDGMILIAVFAGWLYATIQKARQERSDAEAILGESRPWLVLVSCTCGLFLLVLAGNYIVAGGRGIAATFGIQEFIAGATIVAIGTSVPELATTIIANLQGHDEIGLGTVLGSNIFNGLFVVGIASIINPIETSLQSVAAALVFGVVVLLQTIPIWGGRITKDQGKLLLASYVIYLAIIVNNPIH
jgi:cation:H+ antiporter